MQIVDSSKNSLPHNVPVFNWYTSAHADTEDDSKLPEFQNNYPYPWDGQDNNIPYAPYDDSYDDFGGISDIGDEEDIAAENERLGWKPLSPEELEEAQRKIQEDLEHSQSYDSASRQVLDSFHNRVEATLEDFTALRLMWWKLEGYFNYDLWRELKGDELEETGLTREDVEQKLLAVDDEYTKWARDFNHAYREIMNKRDDPDTPFMTARMIEVEISTYAASDEGSFILYHTDFITDPYVREQLEENDRWYSREWASQYYVDTKEQALLRKDEQEMSSIHGRWRGERDPATYLLKHAGLYHYLNDGLGLDIASLSEAARLQLVEFLADASKDDYKRLINAASKMPESGKSQFAEAFLATAFGDDYGGAILDIAERTAPEQAGHIFETVNSLRVRTGEFAKMFQAIDPQFVQATEKALNERITDALTSLQEVAVNGKLHEDVAPHQKNADYVHDGRFDIDVESIDEAMDIIDGLEKTFGAMHKIITAKDLKITKVNDSEDQFVLYRLMSKSAGNMLIYIRPEGGYGYDKQIEYGNHKGVEASISFMVDPTDPHKLLMPKDPDAVSIRFDHEGRLVGEAANSDRRDPTRKDGLISADISSGMGRASSLPVKIGRFIAAGNRIRANREGTEDSLHHNTNYFDQEKYGDSDGFAHLARSVIRQIELLKKTLHGKVLGNAVELTAKSTEFEQADWLEAA